MLRPSADDPGHAGRAVPGLRDDRGGAALPRGQSSAPGAHRGAAWAAAEEALPSGERHATRPAPYLLHDEPEFPPALPPATISPDPGTRVAALVLTIAATTRHLTVSGARTLCGKAIDLATAIRQATFYSYADCAACARLAKAQGRICPACGQPLLQVDADGQCQICATTRMRGW